MFISPSSTRMVQVGR